MGPLAGFKIVELAGIGPVPFCSTLLADLGAEVLRVDRTEDSGLGVKSEATRFDVLARGRRSIAVDLKKKEGVEATLKLIEQADALLEGFRPGVMERLGLGPDVALKRNPRLVYGRMTGWGQTGTIHNSAGHDINYIALAGVLNHIGRAGQPPTPPLNLVGDFGGGAMFLAVGVLAGLLEAKQSGQGQVIDCAMTEGAAYLAMPFFGMRASGFWGDSRGENMLDSGSHFYDVYETKDGKHVSIGSIEPKFYAELLRLTGLDKEKLPEQRDKKGWGETKRRLAAVFKTKTREEWTAIMENTDVCFAPVLSITEAPSHPHNATRGSFVEIDGVTQPAPAPRFSRTRLEVQRPPSRRGQHTREALAAWGFSKDEIAELEAAGAAKQE
jgi:alpha-methylacyl-CoA racemase